MKNRNHDDATRLEQEAVLLREAGYKGINTHPHRISLGFYVYHLVPGASAIERLRVRIGRGWINEKGESEFRIALRGQIIRWWIPGSTGTLGLRTPLGDGLVNWLDGEGYFPTRAKAAERRRELELALEAYAGGKP